MLSCNTASKLESFVKRLTCNLTFHKDDVDHLVDDEGGHAPRHKAEIEMHGYEELPSMKLSGECNWKQGFCGSKQYSGLLLPPLAIA
jgi:hypothetical protein